METRYGRWTVLGEIRKNGRKYCKCRCDCGTIKDVWYRSLENGTSQSCGCLRREIGHDKAVDLTGRRFGKLEVLGSDPNRNGYFICRCDCGNQKSIRGTSLTRKKEPSRSCGCDQRKVAAQTGSRVIAKNSADSIKRNLELNTNIQVIRTNKPPKNNKSGHKGVWYDRNRGLWVAYIQVHDSRKFLGRYVKKEDAIAAREEAEEIYFKPLLENGGIV